MTEGTDDLGHCWHLAVRPDMQHPGRQVHVCCRCGGFREQVRSPARDPGHGPFAPFGWGPWGPAGPEDRAPCPAADASPSGAPGEERVPLADWRLALVLRRQETRRGDRDHHPCHADVHALLGEVARLRAEVTRLEAAKG